MEKEKEDKKAATQKEEEIRQIYMSLFLIHECTTNFLINYSAYQASAKKSPSKKKATFSFAFDTQNMRMVAGFSGLEYRKLRILF